MTMRQLLRQGWENLVGLVFAVAGLLVLLLLFWVNYLVAGLRAAATPPLTPPAEQSPPLPSDEIPEQAQPTPSSPSDPIPPDELHLLPNEGIYIVDGQSLDATINEIVRREQERIAAEKAAAEAKRRAEEARRRKIAEQKRQAEEAKRRAEEKKKAEAKRKAEEKRKAEQARKKAEQQKAAEEKRKAAEKQKAAEAAKRKAAEDKKRKAAEQKKAEEARRKAEAKKKAEQEARRKAKEARELDAKLAALGVGNAPSLEGGLQSAGSAYDQSDIDGYSALLDTAVSRYYRLPDNIPSNLEAEFVIKINASGKVVDVVLRRSSGYPLFDSEARNAIFAASPLPLPVNPALREDTIAQGIKFTFNP